MSGASARPSFLVRLRPEPHVDGIRALRRLLKISLRYCGLRAVELREDFAAPAAMDHPDAWRSSGCDHRRRTGATTTMDMREYAGSNFIRVDDVRGKPWRGRIRSVKIGQHDRPVVEFDTGERLTLNATNTKLMINAYGADSRDWVSVEVELFAGETMFNGTPRESVLVRPISVVKPRPAAATEPPPRNRNDMDDAIPF
jgi:hypothetical protein